MNSGRNRRIVVIDDHPIVAKAVSDMVNAISIGFNSEYFVNSELAREHIISQPVDLIILDIQLDVGDGFSFYRKIKSEGYNGKLIFFTALESQSNLSIAKRVGADGFCTKSMDFQSLKNTIVQVLTHNTSVNVPLLESVKITQKEELVLSYLCEGMTNKQIAEKLYLSPKTISTYKFRILKKYGVSNIIDLMKIKGPYIKN
ncbi:response regulator transcription factor [Vibrio aestuarianus]|uniref:response regulator transcription factor n=1 Tax=Vibrio aestuarianus TaxID=28171 RepID=UPI0015592BD2|nr:response regulator transcription factor [Vibrio aestuarianus]NGZ15638.1 response regulator transcription factor [Vibrio aestuarianus]NKZ51786.1 response regulator transcription factor [Vibrio aestuarianus]